jgi:hypothetical protein
MRTNGLRSAAFRVCMTAALGVAVMASDADGAQAASRRQCWREWRAQRATLRTEGHTRLSFMRACRTGARQPSLPSQPGTKTR